MRDIDHDEAMAEVLKANPAYAAELLATVEADGDAEELAIVRRQMEMAGLPSGDGRKGPQTPAGRFCRFWGGGKGVAALVTPLRAF
ncbi:addiction module antidote protein [Salmonella enterica]|nr:addiction module antidote protein [Salmonella enterica]